jgi:hypothetical protein
MQMSHGKNYAKKKKKKICQELHSIFSTTKKLKNVHK